MDQPPPSGDSLANWLHFEPLISDLSARFIGLRASEVDDAIGEAQRRVCRFLGLDHSVLWQESEKDPTGFEPTHFYFAQDIPRPPGRLSQGLFPWGASEVLAGRSVVLSTVEDLPKEAAVDLENALRFGMKSNVTLPLSVGGEPLVGALAFSTLRAPRAWPEPLLRQLRLVAQVFANAIARRRQDLRLQESEHRLNLAADAAEAGLWTLESRGGAFWLTDRARTVFGFLEGESVDLARLSARVHHDDRVRFDGALERSMRAGEPLSIEYRIVLAGERRARWLAMRGRPPGTMPGDPEQLMGVVLDITDRKRVEAALRKSQARLSASAELAGLGFYELNFEAGAAFTDERFRDFGGIPPGMDGMEPMKFWLEHLHPDDRESVLARREEVHAGRTDQIATEYRYLHPALGERWFHHVARATRRDANGRAVATFGVLRDITESRRREEALQKSNAEIAELKDRLQAESDFLRAEIGVIRAGALVTGESPAIQQVLRMVERVAPTDSSVLIYGETGTGKELVAQALHRQSPRGKHLMVSLNCAALPAGLVESELFGRERGAFTGALTRQIGRFELADHSTLFLDEVGELSPEVQAKLLRVLESGEFERLGNSRTTRVDVRVIAATNRDLLQEVRQGRFREDLYYRLNVFPIRVPPLRERPEDIPVLVWTFLEEFSSRMGKKITQVPRRTMEALQRHRWPGNVRELRNVIEHAAILTTGDILKVEALGAVANVDAPPPRLIDSERELILRALESAGGRIKGPKGAAGVLGLNPSTLYSRMKKLGLRPRRPGAAASA
ncbi:MAG TPA: sigma 54-interacting transcriptional regulator [Vicinamibacteria bacterium]|nr:sigma 54-interacting transcriptional regulator [Vicinamibacteria bacterium]